MQKVCKNCGKTFDAVGNTVYCSTACRIEGRKKSLDKWREDTGYREKHAEAMKSNREKQKAYISLKSDIAKAVRESNKLAKKYSSCIHKEVQTEAQKCLEMAQKYFDAESIEECKQWLKKANKHNGELEIEVQKLWDEVQLQADIEARQRWNNEHENEGKGLYWDGVR